MAKFALFVLSFWLLDAQLAFGQGSYYQRGSTPRLAVRAVNKSKGSVLLNGGRNAGLRKDRPVCFYRNDQTPLGCHRATKVASKKAWVTVPSTVAAQISPGSAAVIGARGSASNTPIQTTSSFFQFGYIFAATTPYSYNVVKHNPDSVSDADQLFWSEEATITSNPAALYMGTEVSYLPNFGITSGVIARIYAPETTFSATYPSDEASYSEHKTVVNSFAVPFTGRYTYGKKKMLFIAGAGIQVDYSQVKYKVWQVNDEAGTRDEIANYLSTVTTMGLRLDLGGGFRLNEHQLSFTVGFVSPLSELNRSVSVSATPPGTGQEAAAGDLESAINHNKTSMGIDVGVTISFGS